MYMQKRRPSRQKIETKMNDGNKEIITLAIVLEMKGADQISANASPRASASISTSVTTTFVGVGGISKKPHMGPF